MSCKSEVLALAFEVRSLVCDLNVALAECFRPLGLTCVQAEALLALAETGPVTLKQLSEHLVAESGHPSRLVSRLVDLGFVDRERSSDDGRAVLLSLTAEGREMARRADRGRMPLVERVASECGGDIGEAVVLLRAVRGALTPAA